MLGYIAIGGGILFISSYISSSKVSESKNDVESNKEHGENCQITNGAICIVLYPAVKITFDMLNNTEDKQYIKITLKNNGDKYNL